MEPKASVFTLDEARKQGVRKDQLYRMIGEGKVERIGRGIFMDADSIDPSLVPLAAASVVRPYATLCLTSALAYHELSDDIPHGSDIALPRGTRPPAGIEHAIWHSFDKATYHIGRTEFQNDIKPIMHIYSPERCIIDLFRMAHLEGSEVAVTALKRWLAKQGNSAASLLEMARNFPRVETPLRQTLEVLL